MRFWISIVAVAALGVVAGAAVTEGAQPPGAEPGGARAKPESQIAADVRHMRPATCGANSLLIYTARGSGQRYGVAKGRGADSMIGWVDAVKKEAIARGWRVREMQAVFTAHEVPVTLRPSSWENYLNGGLAGARRVAKDLSEAWARCRKRKIVVGGYSLGNVPLRFGIAALPRYVSAQIVAGDLIADPTAGKGRDRGMIQRRALDGRVSTGVWTRFLRGPGTTAVPAYPTANRLRSRLAAYCRIPDLVCNYTHFRLNPLSARQGVGHHLRGYRFADIGAATGRTLARHVSRPAPAPNPPADPPTPDRSIRSYDFLNRPHVIECPGTTMVTIDVKDGRWSTDDGWFSPYSPSSSVTFGEGTGDTSEEAAFWTDCGAGGSGSLPNVLVYTMGPDGPVRLGGVVHGREPSFEGGNLVTRQYLRGPEDGAGMYSFKRVVHWRFDGHDWIAVSTETTPA